MNPVAAYALGFASPLLLSLAALALMVIDDEIRTRRRRHREQRQ